MESMRYCAEQVPGQKGSCRGLAKSFVFRGEEGILRRKSKVEFLAVAVCSHSGGFQPSGLCRSEISQGCTTCVRHEHIRYSEDEFITLLSPPHPQSQSSTAGSSSHFAT